MTKMIAEKKETEGLENTKICVIEEKNKKKLKRKVVKIILIIFMILLILLVIIVCILLYMGYKIYNDAHLDTSVLSIKHNNSVVKDISGNTIAKLNGDENRESINLSDMPEYLPKAFVSIEDERFYTHKGVDLKRTARSNSYICFEQRLFFFWRKHYHSTIS